MICCFPICHTVGVVHRAYNGSNQLEREKDNRGIVFLGSRDSLAFERHHLCSRDPFRPISERDSWYGVKNRRILVPRATRLNL